MRAARFFIDAPLVSESQIELPSRVAHHATRVLRLRDGDPAVLFNGSGGEVAATLSFNGKRAFAALKAFAAIERESPWSITLVQAWIANDKLDWVIEKSVELGVQSIVLTPAQRSVVRPAGDRLEKKLERLREVIIAACVQCGRNRVPAIEASSDLAAALQAGLSDGATGMLLHPNAEVPLTKARLTDHRAALAIGPEGGFDDGELALALQLGYHAFSLGPRILRTETAGLAALATLQAVGGDFASG